MYKKHFGLTRKPFSIVPNPEILFPSENHEKALTYLEYGLSEKTGFILLTGEIGSGKTMLIRHLLNQIESQMNIAVIFNTNFSSDQLFRRILNEFEIICTSNEKEKHIEQLYKFLIDRYSHGSHVLLIIDEAQNLSDTAMEDIRMLSNLQTDDQILLQIMLVGQPELRNRLQSTSFRQMAQRIAVNYHIPPLDESETRLYIDYRVHKAGGPPDLFLPDAIKMIYEQSDGIPRSINLLCDTALVYGFSDELYQIDGAVVEKVIEDNICMSTQVDDTIAGSIKKGVTSCGITEIELRIERLEKAVFDLTQKHESLTDKIKNDLPLKYHNLLIREQKRKYQDLLTREKKRYDVLLEKYTKMFQADPHQP